MTLEEASMDETLCKSLRFAEEKIAILNEIISSQRKLIEAMEDRVDQLNDELEDILGNP